MSDLTDILLSKGPGEGITHSPSSHLSGDARRGDMKRKKLRLNAKFLVGLTAGADPKKRDLERATRAWDGRGMIELT